MPFQRRLKTAGEGLASCAPRGHSRRRTEAAMRPRPRLEHHAGRRAPARATTLVRLWMPQQIPTASVFNSSQPFMSGSLALPADGRGQTIAIIDAFDDPNVASDLSAFCSQFGLPQMDGLGGHPTFTKAVQASDGSLTFTKLAP